MEQEKQPLVTDESKKEDNWDGYGANLETEVSDEMSCDREYTSFIAFVIGKSNIIKRCTKTQRC